MDIEKSLGVLGRLDGKNTYASAGFQDQKSDPKFPDFSSFKDGNFVYLVESGFTPNKGKKNEGKYSATLSYSDAQLQKEAGYGMVVNFFQDLRDDWAVYGRYGRSYESFGDFEYATALGIAHNSPLGRQSDQVSVAAFEAKPSDPGLKQKDKGISAYWKWQFTETLDLTLDLQYFFERSKAPADSEENVLLTGLRVRFVF